MGLRQHANNFATTLNGAINNSVTSLVVTSATGLPTISGGSTYNLTLDDLAGVVEIVTVTAAAGTTLTITRGAESTTAVSWANGSVIQLRPTADSLDRKADLVSPALVTPSLGTPTSGTLTNCTGYTEANLSTTDITTNNATTAKHGLLKKLNNDATYYMDGTGNWSVPAGSGGGLITNTGDFANVNGSSNWTATFQQIISYNTAAGATLRLFEASATGSNYVGLKALDSIGTNWVMTLPPDTGTSSYVLQTDGTGVTTWVAQTVADGDKGDITVSSSGATWTIDAGVVLSKLDASTISTATIARDDKVLVRDTSASDATKTVTTQAVSDLVTGAVINVSLSAAQTITNATFTKITLNTETIDSNSNFDPTTNYRFTPTIAGTYMVFFRVLFATTAAAYYQSTLLYKNGSIYDNSTVQVNSSSPVDLSGFGISFVSMNGSTDYLELYTYQTSGGSRTVRGDDYSVGGTTMRAYRIGA